jgi:type IV pilus assembly protein PilA
MQRAPGSRPKIVVAIIGILATIAIPSYQSYTVRAQVAEALVLTGELKPSIQDFYKERGLFPRTTTPPRSRPLST